MPFVAPKTLPSTPSTGLPPGWSAGDGGGAWRGPAASPGPRGAIGPDAGSSGLPCAKEPMLGGGAMGAMYGGLNSSGGGGNGGLNGGGSCDAMSGAQGAVTGAGKLSAGSC